MPAEAIPIIRSKLCRSCQKEELRVTACSGQAHVFWSGPRPLVSPKHPCFYKQQRAEAPKGKQSRKRGQNPLLMDTEDLSISTRFF